MFLYGHWRRYLFVLLPVILVALVYHIWIGGHCNLDLAAVCRGRSSSFQEDRGEWRQGLSHNSPTWVFPPDFDGTNCSNIDLEAIFQGQFPPPPGNIDKIGNFRQTTIPTNATIHGFTIFDELYLRDGTLYAVTDKPDSFPPLPHILSRPERIRPGASLTPTDSEMQIISPDDAEAMLGERAFRLDGFTVLLYDAEQFMNHYYHWWGEIMVGLWRVYSQLGLLRDGSVGPLPSPTRFIAPFIGESGWRDGPSLNGPLMRAAFPFSAVENGHYWQDLIEMEITVVFSRVLVVNRAAAHLHPFAKLWYKMIAGTMEAPAPEGFWEPIRHATINNLLGYTPNLDVILPKPIVTYITRLKRRTLAPPQHRALLRELRKLDHEGLCEVHVVQMEKMTPKEQIELAAKTTIMLGVHGNGLTHQLWMPPSEKSTVIEIFFPEGYAFDYEILARNLGHRHYAIWNDKVLTYPKGKTHKGVNFPPGFHGNEIPLQAEVISKIIRKRLAGRA